MRKYTSLLVFVIALVATAQDTTQPTLQQFLEEANRLAAKATQAFDAEMARDKVGDCRSADTTRASLDCLGKEGKITQANYTAFTEAIGSILALKYPGDAAALSGPTGTPLTEAQRVQEFKELEAAWQKYRELATRTAFDQYRGGTLAPVSSLEADQLLLRSHMRELNVIYGSTLHH